MKRRIVACRASCQPVAPPAAPEALVSWLEEQARALRTPWLLAHADDGVIWGRCDAGGLITSRTALEEGGETDPCSPPLRAVTLQEARLFGPTAELLLWRGEQGGWQARVIRDGAGGDPAVQGDAAVVEEVAVPRDGAIGDTGVPGRAAPTTAFAAAVPGEAGVAANPGEAGRPGAAALPADSGPLGDAANTWATGQPGAVSPPGPAATWRQACEERYLLWGTPQRSLPRGFTLLREGAQGLRHAVPLALSPGAGTGSAWRAWLRVRHYLAPEGLARILASRLYGLEGPGAETGEEAE